MPSDRILEAEGERRRWREAVVSLIEPELTGLRAAQQAHEDRDVERHGEVLEAIQALGERVDRAVEYRSDRTTDPGDRGEVAAALATLAARVEAQAAPTWAPVAGAMAGAIKRASSASWPVYIVVLALVVGGPAVASEVIQRVATVLVGPPTVQAAPQEGP